MVNSCKGVYKKSYDELLRMYCNFYLYEIYRWFMKYAFIKYEYIYEIKLSAKLPVKWIFFAKIKFET